MRWLRTMRWQGWFDAGASTLMMARCLMIIHFLDHAAWCDLSPPPPAPSPKVIFQGLLPCAIAPPSCLHSWVDCADKM